ncbi:MAG: hypothetical protein LBT74_10065 [Acidobacteriota bacterium]|nr:hypothetical protein [Acidobacteriota bacterium]
MDDIPLSHSKMSLMAEVSDLTQKRMDFSLMASQTSRWRELRRPARRMFSLTCAIFLNYRLGEPDVVDSIFNQRHVPPPFVKSSFAGNDSGRE